MEGILLAPPRKSFVSNLYHTRVGKTVRADGKKAAKQYKICVYVLRVAIVLWVFMAIWTFLLYAHSKEMMNLIPTLKSFAPILVPSELNSLSGEEE
nr:unnamed protein product [Haemonchus contortus]